MKTRALLLDYTLDPEAQELFDGISDMFFRIREGHLGRYCFSSSRRSGDKVRGDQHWTKFIESTVSYYPYHDQIEIIRQYAREIGQTVADAGTFIDLGTGSIKSFERKVLPILRAGNFKELIFVDLCSSFSELAGDRLKREKLNIKTSTFIGNFFHQLPKLAGKAAINLFGITLGNLFVDLPHETPGQVLTSAMKHFAQALTKHGGYFIFDYDTNEEEESIHAGYDHPAYHAMEMTVLERTKRDLPTERFNPYDFEHITAWYPQWKLLAQELRAKQDVNFKLGTYEVFVSKDESFRTGNSYKYPDAMVERAVSHSGFHDLKIFQIPNSTMRVGLSTLSARRSSKA